MREFHNISPPMYMTVDQQHSWHSTLHRLQMNALVHGTLNPIALSTKEVTMTAAGFREGPDLSDPSPHQKRGEGISPEALSLVVQGSCVPSGCSLIQVCKQCLTCLLAGVVGKLDRDGLTGTEWFLPIQPFDGLLSFYPLVKADEAHPSGDTCRRKSSRIVYGYKDGT